MGARSLLTFFIPIGCRFGAEIFSAVLDRMGGARLERDSVLSRLLRAQRAIHFLSLTVHNFADEIDDCLPNFGLLVEVSGDGGEEVVLGLVEQALKTPISQTDLRSLASLFPTHCAQGVGEPLSDFLKRNYLHAKPLSRQTSGLCFEGVPGLSVRRIKSENDLATAAFLEIKHIDPKLPNLEKVARLRKRLCANDRYSEVLSSAPSISAMAELEDLRDPAEPKPRIRQGGHWLRPLFFGLVALGAIYFLVPNLLLILILGLVTLSLFLIAGVLIPLRLSELKEQPDERFINPKRYKALSQQENRTALNHMIAVSCMKPGNFRRLMLRAAFCAIAYLATHTFKPGHLDTLNTIHFARWVRIPGTRQLVFLSNYSGSWESYLEDFVTKAPTGLNAVWSNCVGYPQTRWGVREGACQGDPFKRWARRQQIPTGYWFAAYPDLTTDDVRRNTTIQALLSRGNSSQEARELLHLLGQTPAPEAALEDHEIQSLVFGGLKELRFSRAFALDLTHARRNSRTQEFLDFIIRRVGFGETAKHEICCQLAFSNEGFAQLGLFNSASVPEIHRFDPAFEDGMASQTRAAILGDGGESDLARWIWGNADNPAHILLLCYGRTKRELDLFCTQVKTHAKLARMRFVQELTTTLPETKGQKIPIKREPFGFRDGISQPLIQGTARCGKAADPINTVAPGEFILGYKDGNGIRPASFGIPADRDVFQQLPAFRGKGQARFHDFGRNGSYLVVRQLAQDTEAFDKFCTQAAQKAREGGYGLVYKDWIKAKIIGRWQDGRSMVRNPHDRDPSEGAASEPDNDFSYFKEDPHGLACPLGAHIRRANPRDMLTDYGDIETQIKINNRRRILRVGRPYGVSEEAESGAEKGLFFMCLNGDIERQFEFVQQSWLGRDNFGGLRGEVDAISHRQGRRGRRFTIQDSRGNIELTGLPQFVEVRGGGYFFLPSRSALAYLRDQIRTI